MKKFIIPLLLFLSVNVFAQNEPVYSSDFNTYIDTNKTYLQTLTDSVTVLIDSIKTLNGYVDQLEGYVDGIEASLTSIDGKDFSTSAKQDTQESSLNAIETLITTLNGYVDQLEGYVDGIEASLTAIDGNTDRITTPGYTTVSISSTATQLSDVSCKRFMVQNTGTSGSVYFGTDGSITTSTFGFELAARKSTGWIDASNLNQWYGITASGTITIKITYQN